MRTRARRGTTLSALACFFLAMTLPALAQTFRGGIQGTITDTTGGALPGVSVTVTNAATKLSRTAFTDKEGNYFIPELPLGDYTLAVELSGFGPKTVTGIHVEVGSNRRVDLQLSPGGLQEKVEVVATAPLVETTGDTMGGTLGAMEMAALPINGGDFTKLLVLVPGSVGDASGVMDSPGSFGLFSLNGSRGRSNNYLIDGTDMNDGYRNLPAINEGGVFGTPATILPVDAVAEIKVLSGGQAEFGRSSGGVVNIVTKSGANSFHGSGYEFFRNDALDSRNFFNPAPNPKDLFHNNQFGGFLSGPIQKDQTFWFVSYEGQREQVGIPSLSRVPTSAELATATNPVIQRLIALHPWPSPNIASAGPNDPNLLATTNANNRVDSLIVKLDRHIGQADLLTGRYFLGDSSQSFPLAVLGGNVLPGFNTVTPTRVQIVSLSYIHTFTPRLLMEARGGYNRFRESFLPEDGSFNPSSIGLDTGVGAQDFGLPEFEITGYAPIGTNPADPRGRTDTNLHTVLAFSYSSGRHNVKAGYEFRRTVVNQFFDAGYRGVLTFSSLDDFLAGDVDGGRQAVGNSSRQTFQNSHGLYIQDSFAVSRTLTLNYGLRWDYMGVLGEAQNRLSILDPTKGLVQVGTDGLQNLYPPDYRNFGPRASAVWDVTGKGRTVLRANWGIYFDSVLPGLLCRPDPVEHVQPRTGVQRHRAVTDSVQLLAIIDAGGRRARVRSERFCRLRRVHGVAGPHAHAVHAQLQRQHRAATRVACVDPARLRRIARSEPVPLPRHQPGRSGDGRATVRQRSVCARREPVRLRQPVRGHGPLHLQRVPDRADHPRPPRVHRPGRLHLVAFP